MPMWSRRVSTVVGTTCCVCCPSAGADVECTTSPARPTPPRETGRPDVAHLPALTNHLFVYGTLRPGEVRWRHLEPFVVGVGLPDAVRGHLFDTGLGYPAAILSGDDYGDDEHVRGQTFELQSRSIDAALERLDEVEGAVRGLYRRIEVLTERGARAWAYEYDVDPDAHIALTRIVSGDWSMRHA